MGWVFFEIKQDDFLSPSQPPYSISQPPPPLPVDLQSGGLNFNNKVSPSILLIIIIIAIIFFISGLLHLLVRYLLRPQNRDPDDLDNVTALQGQLQQLFHLHDSGVDQSFIDTLPVFNYKAIIGVKNPFDCAVCLCEFEPEDKLRLLPKCSHAFHMECIDTWLLSHSTCPLCRATLLPDFSPNHYCSSPIVLVLESGSDSSREIVSDRDGPLGTTNSIARANSHLGFHCRNEFVSSGRKSCEIPGKTQQTMVGSEEKVVAVKLGKFRNVDGGGEGSSSNNNVDARRCFSMGSFAYVMDENSSLQVPIRTPVKKQSSKKSSLPLTPGHKPAMSECDSDSRRDFNGSDPFKSVQVHGIGTGGSSTSNGNGNGNDNDNAIGRSKRESFSVSKIWMRAKKEKPHPMGMEVSRRAFSFRFPVHRSVVSGDDMNPKSGGSGTRRTISEIAIGRWENGGGSELGCDEENQSCNSLASQPKTPSFAKRTMLWLVGRQNKDPKEGNWWMQFGSQYVLGYWPSYLFSYLADSASMIEWGGEVVNSASDGQHTTTQMGSGHFPGEGFGKSSYFRNIEIVDGSNNLRAPKDISTFTEQSNCYDVQTGKNGDWGNYFYYGGPGRNPNCP